VHYNIDVEHFFIGFGFSSLTSQLLTAPPCAVATIGVLAGGYLAGRYNRRSPLLVVGSIIVAIGYLCLLVLYDKWGKGLNKNIIPMVTKTFTY
jgi:MFS family permease